MAINKATEHPEACVLTVRSVPTEWHPHRTFTQTESDRIVPHSQFAARRQETSPAFVADGTAYVFRRSMAPTIFDWPRMKELRFVKMAGPYINVDTPADWHALCKVIRRRRQTAS